MQTVPEKPIKKSPALGVALIASLAGAFGALLLFSWLAREVIEGELRNFDLQVRMSIYGYATPGLTTAMRVITTLGSFWFLLILFALIGAFFFSIRWRRAVGWLALSTAGAVALDDALKSLFHRARPTPLFITLPETYSFPSGHALVSFCFYMVLAGLLTARMRGVSARVLIWIAASLVVGAIGFSRIYLGVHWPSDVIAGYAAGAVWVSGLVSLDRWRKR